VRAQVVFALLVTAALACVSRFTGRDVEVMNEDLLPERAGFELVGVEGCGEKAVSVRTNDGLWVADPAAAPSR
jgi:hypothetical protein